MKKPSVHPRENFLEALGVAASFEPLEVGKVYKYRRHTGPGSYVQDEATCYARHIQQTAKRLGVTGMPFVKDGQLNHTK